MSWNSSFTDEAAWIGLLAVLPWGLVGLQGRPSVLFLWGTLTLDPLHATSILTVHRLGGGPRVAFWLLAVLAYLGAVAVATVGRAVDTEPRVVTAGLLGLAGLAYLRILIDALAAGTMVLPVAPLVALGGAWWYATREG